MNKERERQIRGKNYSVDHTPMINELWVEIDDLRAQVKALKREANTLRQYGNKDCTAMADAKLEETSDIDSL